MISQLFQPYKMLIFFLTKSTSAVEEKDQECEPLDLKFGSLFHNPGYVTLLPHSDSLRFILILQGLKGVF
jgi:hypothetical protein